MNKPLSSKESKNIRHWLQQQKSSAANSLTISMVMSILASFILIAQTAVLAYLVNQVVFLKSAWQEETLALYTLIVFILMRVILTKYIELFAFAGAGKIKLALREQIYQKLITLGPSYLADKQSAQLAELLNKGVDELELYYARYLPAVAYCAILPFAILVVVLPIDWLTGLIFLATAPLVPFFMILIGLKAESLNQQHWQQLTRMSNHFLDVLQGLAQLKLFNASRNEAKAIASIADKYRRSTMSILKVAFLSSFALEFLATLSVALVAVVVGFRLYWGELDFAIGFMLLLLAPEFYLPFRNLGTQYHAKMKGVAAAQEMLKILNSQPLHYGKQALQELKKGDYTIDFCDVSFQYPGGREALKGLNCSIAGRGLHAIIGQSGAGKSTLVDLLLGFLQPSHGVISINGQNIQSIQRSQWLEKLAWVPQNPQLIYASILDNIQLASPNASIAQVKAAATKAGVDQFVHKFSDGWNHIIGERGAGISGGQKQRIAMARVFLKQAEILILDEPSAHLDEATEQWLSREIKAYAKEHCVIVVAHRLHTIEDAESILLLADATLVAQGSHQTLKAQNSLYQELLAKKDQYAAIKIANDLGAKANG